MPIFTFGNRLSNVCIKAPRNSIIVTAACGVTEKWVEVMGDYNYSSDGNVRISSPSEIGCRGIV